MAFNDGDPIDAAKLAALEQQLNLLSASVPRLGASSTTINYNNSTIKDINPQQIIAGDAGKFTFTRGKANVFDLTFKEVLNSTPKAIFLQTRLGSTSTGWMPQVNVVTGTTTASGCKIHCYLPTSTNATVSVYISYMAIAY